VVTGDDDEVGAADVGLGDHGLQDREHAVDVGQHRHASRRRPPCRRTLSRRATVGPAGNRLSVPRRGRYGSRMPAAEDYFGDEVAATYDDAESEMFDAAVVGPTVDLIAELAGGGAALELGVGTGRIALPLAARGVPVHGTDLSAAMLALLLAKPGGDTVGATLGDLSTTRVEGRFAVVYLVFNTIMNLTTQDAQVACFANAADHLEPGGAFVVEVMVPDLQRLPPGQDVVPFHVGETSWAFDRYDVVTQAMSSTYVDVAGGEVRFRSTPFRYVWPAELDLMARLAGLRLRDRWDGWTKQPFTSGSRRHVSVWDKPAA